MSSLAPVLANSPEAASPPILAAQGVTKRFGAFTALENVDFAVRSGEVHALLGENGAGKSTLMNILSGLLRPTSGEILLDGAPVRFASPSDAERRGIGMVHQHFLLVPPLSVRENLLLGAAREMGGPLSYPTRKVMEEAHALADRLGWGIPWDAPAGSLPVGTQQRIEILKALRGQTRVLIFDEPTAVLTPTETPELFETIRRLADEGRGIVFISHKLDEVLSLAQTITVLRRGHVVHRAASEATAASLAEAMVGSALAPVPGDGPHPRPLSPVSGFAGGRGVPVEQASSASHIGRADREVGEAEVVKGIGPPLPARSATQEEGKGVRALLNVSRLTLQNSRERARPLLSDITFEVAAGEIFGIAGVDGNGQAELADCLAGLTKPDSEEIRVGGVVPAAHPAAFRRAGVAVIPADRQRRGLALPLPLTENLTLGVHDRREFRRGPLLRWGTLRRRATDLIRRYDIRATGPDALARSLSGGNQQKVVIARALAQEPRVIVAVNPTRGLDVGAIAYVHNALRRAQAGGAAIVLISTELDEVVALSDRIAVLYEGAFSGIVAPDAPRETIGLLMGGKQAPSPPP